MYQNTLSSHRQGLGRLSALVTHSTPICDSISGKKKAHKHKPFCPAGSWDDPGFVPGISPGLSLGQTRVFVFLLISHSGSPANPGLSVGQTRVVPGTQERKRHININNFSGDCPGGGGVSRPGGGGSPDRWPGVKSLCAVCGTQGT